MIAESMPMSRVQAVNSKSARRQPEMFGYRCKCRWQNTCTFDGDGSAAFPGTRTAAVFWAFSTSSDMAWTFSQPLQPLPPSAAREPAVHVCSQNAILICSCDEGRVDSKAVTARLGSNAQRAAGRQAAAAQCRDKAAPPSNGHATRPSPLSRNPVCKSREKRWTFNRPTCFPVQTDIHLETESRRKTRTETLIQQREREREQQTDKET